MKVNMIHTVSTLRRTALCIIAAGILPLSGHAADQKDALRAIVDASITPVMAKFDLPGMAVAVIVDGQPHYFNYGVASRAEQLPVSEHTLFELGSVSKVFTATLASYAEGAGKLSLADHPGKYMPQLKGRPIDKATLLHLGTYTAGGLPLQFPDGAASAGAAKYFQQWKPDALPGLQRRYSNPSLGLFGHVTALALKRDFADAMQNELLPALGLQHSYIRVPASDIKNLSWGYDQENKPIRMNPGIFGDEAYGLRSSTVDMARFVQVNMDPALLPPAARHAVKGTQVGYFKVGSMTQGLGWEQYAYPLSLETLLEGNSSQAREARPVSRIATPGAASSSTLFNKTGSTDGFGSYVAFVPAAKVGIVMLANKSYPNAERIKVAHAILTQVAAQR